MITLAWTRTYVHMLQRAHALRAILLRRMTRERHEQLSAYFWSLKIISFIEVYTGAQERLHCAQYARTLFTQPRQHEDSTISRKLTRVLQVQRRSTDSRRAGSALSEGSCEDARRAAEEI